MEKNIGVNNNFFTFGVNLAISPILIIYLYYFLKRIKVVIINKKIKEQPAAWPHFLCLPCFVSGTPILRDILFFAAEIPTALFQEKDRPNFLPI